MPHSEPRYHHLGYFQAQRWASLEAEATPGLLWSWTRKLLTQNGSRQIHSSWAAGVPHSRDHHRAEDNMSASGSWDNSWTGQQH